MNEWMRLLKIIGSLRPKPVKYIFMCRHFGYYFFIYILFQHFGYYFFIYILFRHVGFLFFIYILFGLLSRFIYQNGPSSFISSPNQPFRQHFFSSVVVSGPKTDSFRILFVPKRKIPRVQNNLFIWQKNQTHFTLFFVSKRKAC
jgi:hypothetical protein